MNKIIINLNSLQPKDRALVTSLYSNVAASTCVGSAGNGPSDSVGAPLLGMLFRLHYNYVFTIFSAHCP